MSNIQIRNEEDGTLVRVADTQKTGDVPVKVSFTANPRGGASQGAHRAAPRQNPRPLAGPERTPEEDPGAGSFEEFISPENERAGSSSEEEESMNFDDGDHHHQASADDQQEFNDQEGAGDREEPSLGFADIISEKRDILVKLHRLKDKGHTVRQFTMASNIQDMRTELSKIQYGIDCKNFSDLSLQVILTTVNLLETGNEMFDPFGLELEGWGSEVYDKRANLQDPLEELFQKYRTRAAMPPELKILIAVGGMGAMVHYKRKWANRMFGVQDQKFQQQSGGMAANVPMYNQPQYQQQMPANNAPMNNNVPVNNHGDQPMMQGPPFAMPPISLPQFNPGVANPPPVSTRVPNVPPHALPATPTSGFLTNSSSCATSRNSTPPPAPSVSRGRRKAPARKAKDDVLVI